MENFMRILFLVFIMSLSQTAFAENCTPLTPKLHDKNLVLTYEGPKDSAQVYFFHNIGQQGVWLDHPHKKSLNAGWSSYVRTNNWSAFLLNRKNFEISCAVIQPGNVNYLDCSKIISVCTSKYVKLKTPKQGTYWLAEDKPWNDLTKAVAKRGIRLS